MRNLIILTVFICLQLGSFAQNPNGWIQEGAEWHHKFLYFTKGYMRYYLEGDIDIDGTIFQQVKGEEQRAYLQSDGSYVLGSIEPSGNRLYFTSNDSVYVRKSDGSLQFAWYLNPQVGDVWDFGEQYDEQSETTLNAYAVVYNVEQVEINGVQTLEIFTTPCLDELGTLPSEDDTYFTNDYAQQINSVFGPVKFFTYAGSYFLYPLPYQLLDFYGSELLCYESDEMSFYQVPESVDCYDGIHSLSIDDLDQQRFVVYPNPAKEQVHFSGLSPNQDVLFFSNLGQAMFTIQGKQTQTADVSNLASGLYYYRIVEGENSEVYFGKFVKE